MPSLVIIVLLVRKLQREGEFILLLLLQSPQTSPLLLHQKKFVSILFLVNGPRALQVNLSCLKCISEMNLSPANKILFII